MYGVLAQVLIFPSIHPNCGLDGIHAAHLDAMGWGGWDAQGTAVVVVVRCCR